ncbi:MAG: Crp/Fnr family transcriptional regulator [Tenuifilaceae bacterium]
MDKIISTPCIGVSCGECGFRSTVFDCLSIDQLELLSKGKDLLKAKKGEVIIKQGEKVNDFIFLRVGLAKLSRVSAEGKEQLIGIARPKDFVGLLSLFSSPYHKYSIIAIEDSEFCVVEIELINNLVKESGKFAFSLLQKISQVSDMLLSTKLDIDNRQLRGRIAFILDMFSKEVYESTKFNLPISRKEIGELIDMRVENVVRILSEFRKDKIISIEGTTIELLQPDKLEWIKNHG